MIKKVAKMDAYRIAMLDDNHRVETWKRHGWFDGNELSILVSGRKRFDQATRKRVTLKELKAKYYLSQVATWKDGHLVGVEKFTIN